MRLNYCTRFALNLYVFYCQTKRVLHKIKLKQTVTWNVNYREYHHSGFKLDQASEIVIS
jgi:hypothetical protein